MKLNRKLVLMLALVLSLAVATSGTLAFLSDADKDVNTMTLGRVEIVQNEQQRVDNTTNQGKLEEFKQDKPLLPADFEGSSIPWAPADEWVVPGEEAWRVVEDNVGVVDKFVTVTNTGKTPAYVRTIIAYEGDATYGPNGAYIHTVTNGPRVNPPIPNEFVGYYEIDGVTYSVFVYTYPAALEPGETSIPSLKQVYMNKAATNEVVEQYGEKYDILVLSQAVQTQGFENAETALEKGFGEVNAENLNEWLKATPIGSPNGDKNDTNNPPVPFANVKTIGAEDTLTNKDGDVTVVEKNRTIDTTQSKMGMDVGKIPLDVAYQFQPTMSFEEAEASEYADWHADFVVSANKEIPPFGIGLAGYYDAWCSLNNDKWVLLASDAAIPANEEIRLVESAIDGFIIPYEALCQYGNDGIGFLCGAVAMDGIKWNGETIDAPLTEGTTITVELRLYEATGGSVNDETDDYITTGVYTYTFQ